MAKVQRAEPGTFGLIQETSDGRIVQIALTESQSEMLQVYLAMISSAEKPLLKLGEEYDLVGKGNLCAKCKTKN